MTPGSMSKALRMSTSLLFDTVSNAGILRETLPCMRAKACQRIAVSFRHPRAAFTASVRSRVIGWWMVATTGSPRR